MAGPQEYGMEEPRFVRDKEKNSFGMEKNSFGIRRKKKRCGGISR